MPDLAPPTRRPLRPPLRWVTGLVLCPILLLGQVEQQGAADLAGARPVPRDRTVPTPLGPNSALAAGKAPLSQLQPIYFPAAIPILGSELPAAPAVRDPLWNDFGPHVNEVFFAPLTTRLADGNLHRRLRQRLDAYQAARTTALADLRRHLESPGPVTDAALDAKLAELATAADTLRRDLYTGGFLTPNADWNQHRNWRLGQDTKRSAQDQLYDEMTVLRAAIYYQEGLSAPQRELLREIVQEIADTLGAADTPALADSFEPVHVAWFLPHGSRLRVPADLPDAVAADLDTLTAEKNALKRELRDTLRRFDDSSDSKRQRVLQELAAAQEPRLAALETLAERIRAGFAARPDASQPATQAAIPPTLAQRIDAYLRAKAELQNAARQAGDSAQLAAFETENRQRFAALAAEARAIREEVARAAQTGAAPRKNVDALLADFMAAFKQQQLESLYQDYRTAVLRPGLSPAQRQLLFNAALAGLSLTGVKDWQAVPE